MIVLNLFGGPSAGKSTVAAHIFAHLKRHDILTELVGEFAKELIYLGNTDQLVNQVYIMGNQYRKLKDLERHGTTIAISDSPLLMQCVYCKGKPYEAEIIPLLKKLDSEFKCVNVFVRKFGKHQSFGRVHDEAQSQELSKVIWEFMDGSFHYVIDGNITGADSLAKEALALADKELIEKY